MLALTQRADDVDGVLTGLIHQPVTLCSLGERLSGELFLPAATSACPAMIICHGSGEFKENYLEMGKHLARNGVAALLLDMHGHGQSGGERFHVNMTEWVNDVQVALDYLGQHPRIAAAQIGAFGLSSGGTAILEAALVDSRLKALVAFGPTVHNSLPLYLTVSMKLLSGLGRIKKRLTGRDLRIRLLGTVSKLNLACDPEVNRRLRADKRLQEAFLNFPLPGAAQAFFVSTLSRVARIRVPTLILWGEEDRLDSPDTGRLLFRTLTCKKQLHIIPGSGHVGHVDCKKDQVFALTANWAWDHLASRQAVPAVASGSWTITGDRARSLSREEKWKLFAPFLRQHGHEALSYATLQEGMEYFIDDCGYLAFVTVRHPVFARQPKRIVLCDPLADLSDYPKIISHFLEDSPQAVFGIISEKCAETLRGLGFKANCLGYESELPIQTYNTQGNWKEFDLIKRARNEAKREGLEIKEVDIATVNKDQLAAVTARWIATKKVNDREIWIYARRPVYEPEEEVRKFVAYDRDGRVVGFAFYDPIYRGGRVIGYSDVISRCDEHRFGRLATAMHMVAIEQFKLEGKEVFNLNLAPFSKLALGKYNDDAFAMRFFQLSEKYGNNIYNFRGLSFHKSKYRGREKPIYFATKSLLATNDLYLAFYSADISQSYWLTVFQLLRGILAAPFRSRSAPPGKSLERH